MRAAPALLTALLLFVGAIGTACSRTVVVPVPPRVDLGADTTIGVIPFAVEGLAPPVPDVTQRFLASVHAAQPGVRFLELGPEGEVLRAVGRDALDFEAVRAVGARFGVDAVLTGRLSVSPAKPSFSVKPDLTALSARASVSGELHGRLRETSVGATVWTNGASGTWHLASVGLNAEGVPTHGRLPDADRTRDRMIGELVHAATDDFRPGYRRHKVTR
ncbi:MAG: hypothetical protein ACNA8S_05105 [Deferrisomatales bacterium]